MKYDVVIIGAGPAGLSFACSLKDTNLQVLLLDSAPLNSIQTPIEDGREIALTHASLKIMQDLGAWQHISEADIAPICAAKVFDGDSSYSLSFDNDQADLEALGYLVPNHIIRQALYQAVTALKNVTLRCDSQVEDLASCESHAWVQLADERIECNLLISADSRFSQTRRKMGIAASMNDFSRSAIVCRMTHSLPHHQTALECFHYGRTLAILPMQGNKSSIVVTVSSDEAESIQRLSNEQFASDIAQRLKGQLGDMQLTGIRHLYPLVGVHAKRFISQRFAVIGDAAVGMHPVTAHGFNLGLRSQQTLADEVILALSKHQ
ncbi:MAG: 5-demethoxyubiquinol-8 5-hydroxylase UbiM, partial [Oceanospirillaceae bacterium]